MIELDPMWFYLLTFSCQLFPMPSLPHYYLTSYLWKEVMGTEFEVVKKEESHICQVGGLDRQVDLCNGGPSVG